MNLNAKTKINFKLLIPIILFMVVSILSIYSSQNLLSSNYNNLFLKQIFWYILGFLIIFIIRNINDKYIMKYTNLLYILGNILLILVLFIGSESNGAKCWFNIPGIGSFQPSEFMKIILILILARELSKYEKIKKNFKSELIVILKCFLIVLIPSILIFLEPDTGIVFIFLTILTIMLFVYGIRYRWFISLGTIIAAAFSFFIILFFKYQDIFIKIFGSNFFYRMDRLLDWKNGAGMQLTNALAATGSAGLMGYGIGKTPIYFPEPHTDFIFSIFTSNFGFFFASFLILLTLYFDMQLIIIASKSNFKNKLIISGILAMLLFQQIQNIGMNIGLLPITGITLPFISYGGSSLISYMIIIGIVLGIEKENS